MTRAGLRGWAGWGALLAGVAATFFWYIGYFGGPVFRLYPPDGHVRPGVAAVVLSGDMGLDVGMGAKIATALANDGVPVVGINSLTYFRVRRTPAEVRNLIEAAAARAAAVNGATRLILIGQSFGADMLHLGLAQAAPAFRRHVALVGLIVPLDSIDLRASPAELFSLAPPDGPAITTARQLTWAPTLCVYGRSELDSLCPQLQQHNVWKVPLPGGHMLRHDSAAVIAAVRAAIDASVA